MKITKHNNAAKFLTVAACIPVLLLGLMMLASPLVMAAPTDNVTTAVNMVIKIIKILGAVVGVILIVQGGMKYAMAHANDNGPEQTKAITTLAAGVVLIIFALVIIDSLNIASWITGVASGT